MLASHVSDETAKFPDSGELFLLSLAELPKESSRLQAWKTWGPLQIQAIKTQRALLLYFNLYHFSFLKNNRVKHNDMITLNSVFNFSK